MREIKFRVFSKEGEQMMEWDELLDAPDFEDFMKHAHKEDGQYSKLMQYTGLNDKNGVEIYEGDVVNVNNFGGTPRYEKVEFYTNAGFAGIHPFTDSGHHWASKNCEVVGNIYESAKLFNT